MPSFTSRIIDGFKSAIRATIKFPMQGFSGFGGDQSWGWFRRLLPGSRVDFAAEAGDLWLNSIVMIAHKWQARVFPEAPFVVYKESDEDGAQDEGEIVKNHPLTELIKRPNPYYTGTILWMATLLSLLVSGNAFWFIERSGSGKPVRLWWVPHWMVRPTWDPDSGEFIKAYRYQVNGQYYLYAESDFVHFRDGIDPRDQRMGLSCLAAEIRHICTDNEWATFSFAISRNMGIPGVVIKPPPAKPGDTVVTTMGLPTVNLIRATFREKFSRDKAGMPLVLDTALDVQPLGFSPKDLMVDMMRKLPEERVSAATGIPAVVLGLGAGLKEASAKASHEDSQRQAYYGNIIPMQRILAEEIDLQLLPDMMMANDEFSGFDKSRVWFLKPDMALVITSAVEAFSGGIWKLSQAQAKTGEKPDASIDGYAWQLGATGQPPKAESKDDPNEPDGKKKSAGSDDDEDKD